MKDDNYIAIQGWMRTELNLKGTELLVYAIIYGFSQDGNSVYSGTTKYLADWVGASREHINRTLKDLTDRGLIIKIEKIVNGVKLYDYKTGGCDKMSQGVIKCQGGCDKMSAPCDKISHHIYIDNNLDKGNNKTINSFITKEKDDSTDVGKDRVRKNTNTVKEFIPPTLEECKAYAKEIHCWKELGIDFYNYYSLGGWTDKTGKKIKAWKQKMYQWYMHDKEKYYNDIPEPHIPTEEEIQNFKRAEPLRKV